MSHVERIVDFDESKTAYSYDEMAVLLAAFKTLGMLGERIVRCKDCRHYTDHEWVIATDVDDVCHFWHGEPTKVEPDGFCKWGERRDA